MTRGEKGAFVKLFLESYILLLFFLAGVILAIPAVGEPFGLPDTGQTNCYDLQMFVIPCPAPGQAMAQDGSYSMNPLSYTDNGNGTVTDNNTGLMWQKDDDGVNYNWYQASGTYDDALNSDSRNVCGELRTGGYSDWRLPTRRELVSIVNYGVAAPSVDTKYFPTTKSNAMYYWSSDVDASAYTTPGIFYAAWGVEFYVGTDSWLKMGLPGYVRCVRGGGFPSQDFVDNGDGTITDRATSLTWEEGENNALTWDAALSFCEGSSLGGHSDWRLPNIRELESLTKVDADTLYGPVIDLTMFPGAHGSQYWSSTPAVLGLTYDAWVADFYEGEIYSGDITNSAYVRCVRGGGTSEPSCTYSISPESRSHGSGSENGTIGVTASDNSCSWVAVSNDSWITITSGSGGNGNGMVSYSITANPTTSARTGTITIQEYTFTINQAGSAGVNAIPLPSGQQTFVYDPVVSALSSVDPSQAKPIGVGSVANGGDTLSLQVDIGQFAGPVDVYFVLYFPALDSDNFYLLKSDYTIQAISSGFLPWKPNATDRVTENLFGDIPISGLPAGTYFFGLLVSPAGSGLNNYYFWVTSFDIHSVSTQAAGIWDSSQWDVDTWGP
jgi:Protein of unknown function (DUF1566)/Putative binding domain, N-terminal